MRLRPGLSGAEVIGAAYHSLSSATSARARRPHVRNGWKADLRSSVMPRADDRHDPVNRSNRYDYRFLICIGAALIL